MEEWLWKTTFLETQTRGLESKKPKKGKPPEDEIGIVNHPTLTIPFVKYTARTKVGEYLDDGRRVRALML